MGTRIIPRSQHKRRPWLDRLAIIGGAARGLVDVIIGGTAINAAFHVGRHGNDMPGAFKIIVDAPMGRILLGVMAAGLAAFALWCLLEAILDTTRKGTSARGLAERAAAVFIAALYAASSFFAARLMFEPTLARGTRIQGWTALLLAQPLGQWLAGILGLMIICAGLYQLAQAIRGGPNEHDRPWLRWMARYAFASRGLLFLVVGGFMIVAGILRAPAEARGIGGAFRFIERQPVGSTLLCAIGGGVALFGIMFAVEAFRTHSTAAKRKA